MNEQALLSMESRGIDLHGKNVLACVSGGADSMALLYFLAKNRAKLGIEGLYACHFNHGTRGAENTAEQALVSEYAAKIGVELTVGYGHMSEREKPSKHTTESWARELRYDFFEREAAVRSGVIATAHTKSDRAETLLLNLTRGSGIKGARSISPDNGKTVRPLIDITRDEIESYCAKYSIPFATDSSNLTDDFSRNRIRHNVIPALLTVNGNALGNIARFCDEMTDNQAFLDRQTSALLEKAKLSQGRYDRVALLEADSYLRKLALKRILEESANNISKAIIDSLDAALVNGYSKTNVEQGLYFVIERGEAGFAYDEDFVYESEYEKLLEVGFNRLNDAYAVDVSEIDATAQELKENSKFIYNNSLDCGKIIGDLYFRTAPNNEPFRSERRRNTKTVKKLLWEHAIPPVKRPLYPALFDDEGLVWFLGEGVSERIAADNQTSKVIYISLHTED